MTSPNMLRDVYGFEVKREYLELYQKYAPLWEKEETERCERWALFLSHFDDEESAKLRSDERQAAQLARLELEISTWRHTDRGRGSVEAPPWQQQLRSLLQAGIPMALRGKLWKILLDLTTKRKEGVYDRLVVKALGKKHRIRRKTDELEAGSPGAEQGASNFNVATLASAEPLTAQSAAPTAIASPPQGLTSGAAEGLEARECIDPAAHLSGRREPLPAGADGEVAPVSARADAEEAHGSGNPPPQRTRSKQWHPSCRDWNLQIEKDLHRTFPGHPVMDSSGRSALRRILAAYARRNPSVGYCQGMNFIAGCLLLFMDEEDAFWALAAVVEDLLPGYFSLAMVAPQVDQLVFKAMVESQFKTLAAHLEKHSVSVTSVSTQWFLCIFVNSLPLETCLRVWDVFFFECCSSVLFRVALALVDIYNQALLSTMDSVDAFGVLQQMAPMSYDSSRLVDVACIAFSHITHPYLNQLRSLYFGQVAQLVQEAGSSLEGDVVRRHTSDEVELVLKRSMAATPNFFVDGLPLEPEAVNGSGHLQDSDGFQLVPPLPQGSLPSPFQPPMEVLELSDATSQQSEEESPIPSPSPLGSPGVPEVGWHDTPVWPDITTFSQHTLRHLSRLSNVTLTEQAVSSLASPRSSLRASQTEEEEVRAPGAEAEGGPPGCGEEGERGMEEAVYKAAAATTARLAAGLPAIQVCRSPLDGKPLQLPDRAMSEALWKLLLADGAAPSGESLAAEPRLDRCSRSDASAAAFQIAATRGDSRDAHLGQAGPQDATSSDAARLEITPGDAASLPEGGEAAEKRNIAAAEDSREAGGRGPAGGAKQEESMEEGVRTTTMHQLLTVVEGLENELFLAEARRHDAEVEADALAATAEGLRDKVKGAQGALGSQWARLQSLQADVATAERDASAAEKQAAIQAEAVQNARAQLALRESLLAEKDSLIESLQRQLGLVPENVGMRLLRGFSRFRRSPAPEAATSSDGPS